MAKRAATGLQARHQRSCASHRGARCSCTPTWRARIDVPGPDGKRHRKSQTFASEAEARAWRSDAQREVRLGKLRATSPITVREFANEYAEAALSGARIARKGRSREAVAYKPSSARAIEEAFRLRVIPALGARKMADVRSADVRRLVERWDRDGLGPSTIRASFHALRALYRRALELEMVHVDPTEHVPLPRHAPGRERVASPVEAATLLATLSSPLDRAMWGLALYAGLRRGEILALRWADVDMAARTIRVERSWDVKAGVVPPKTEKGRRTVPLVAQLRPLIAAHRLAAPDALPEALVFGRANGTPVQPTTVRNRAYRQWAAADVEPIGLHEGRHTFASLLIAAGANLKAVSTLMGHSSVSFTLDRYGHLLPGAEHEAGDLLAAYLERTQSRGA